MPQRSARSVIHNMTSDFRLVKTYSHLCHGEWTPGGWEPPAAIEPGATGGMQSESDGILTGTEGCAKYDVMEGQLRLGMIYVYWDNPWLGITHPKFATSATDVAPDCDYDGPLPTTSSSQFAIDTTLGFTLVPSGFGYTEDGGEGINLGTQAFWAAGLIGEGPGIFAGDVIEVFGFAGIEKDPKFDYELHAGTFAEVKEKLAPAAPAAPAAPTGGHHAAGFNFVLPHDMPGTATAQDAWRYCGRCHGMFYDGFPDKGTCPLGGGHAAAGFNFVLPHDMPGTATAQDAWRFCDQCHGMFYDGFPDKGRCPKA